MKWSTLLPVSRNDGTPVSPAEQQQILARIWQQFGGLTIEGRTEGYWVDGEQTFKDECLKVTVACDNDRLPEVQALVKDLGKQLGQLAMYLEVQYYDGVQIIRCD